MKKVHRTFIMAILILLTLPVACWNFNSCGARDIADEISNGIVGVNIDSKTGSFTILDLKKNQAIIEDAKIAFSIAGCVDLNLLSDKLNFFTNNV